MVARLWYWLAQRFGAIPALDDEPSVKDSVLTLEMVETYHSDDGLTTIKSLGGVDWYSTDLPPRSHKCWVQTEGWINLRPIYRCACGAISDDSVHWDERNSRKNP